MIREFRTPDGRCIPAITTAQMREVDRIAMEETGPNLLQMMENAGRNLAELTMTLLGEKWQEATIIALAGTGGNGGGGICAARHLANHGGRVFLAVVSPDRLDEVPAQQRRIFASTPGRDVTLHNAPQPDLILDAVIGYSLRGAPRGDSLQFIKWANAQQVQRLSLDVPSGVDSTTGEAAGEFMRSTATLTLALPKTGLLPERTGELYLGDIGIPPAVYKKIGINYKNPFLDSFIVKLHSLPDTFSKTADAY